jgi:hypothetical protein
MKTTRNWKAIGGTVVHVLVGGIMVLAGSAKVLGFFPPEQLAKNGLGDQIMLIGAGELIAAILLLVPRTASLGVLLTSGFWGGAICLHMSRGESYMVPSIFLLLAWAGAYLRLPRMFSSFQSRRLVTRSHAIAA